MRNPPTKPLSPVSHTDAAAPNFVFFYNNALRPQGDPSPASSCNILWHRCFLSCLRIYISQMAGWKARMEMNQMTVRGRKIRRDRGRNNESPSRFNLSESHSAWTGKAKRIWWSRQANFSLRIRFILRFHSSAVAIHIKYLQRVSQNWRVIL